MFPLGNLQFETNRAKLHHHGSWKQFAVAGMLNRIHSLQGSHNICNDCLIFLILLRDIQLDYSLPTIARELGKQEIERRQLQLLSQQEILEIG